LVRNEEGGVLTKKVIAAVMVMSLVMTAALIMIPTDDVEGAQFDIIGGKTLFYPGERLEANADDGIYLIRDDGIYRYTARVLDSSGGVRSGVVSPTSGTFNKTATGLTITAPSVPGDYTLEVTFFTGSSSSSESFVKTYPIKVVEPIKLSVELRNNSKVNITGLTVKFVVDGKEYDATEANTNITIPAYGTKTVTFDWVVDSPAEGRHTFHLTTEFQGVAQAEITGIGEEIEFFIGQSSNTLVTVLMLVITIILVIILIWVVRKPVKNFGKPKGRR
jgi:hypothetical protein